MKQILDDPRMSGDAWLPRAEITQEMLDAWPVWSVAYVLCPLLPDRAFCFDTTLEEIRKFEVARPLRVPGMNRDGVIRASAMTTAHFDRIRDWQWRDTARPEWNECYFPVISEVETAAPGEQWRPAIWADLKPRVEPPLTHVKSAR